MTDTNLEQTLPGRYYLDDSLFRDEQTRLFSREWFCVGREEELPGSGDYMVRQVANEHVLVVRDKQGVLHGHYNVCRHRGSQLVINNSGSRCSGNFPGAIRCPYHSWTYELDGSLRKATHLDTQINGDKRNFTLHPAGIACWGGFIFICLDSDRQDADSFTRQLDEIPQRTSRYGLDKLVTASTVTYEARANWKVILENYNECYHCGPVHPELCEIVPAFRNGGGGELDWDNGIPYRAGADTFTLSGTSGHASIPGLDEHEQTRHKGELLYPNLLLSMSRDHVAAFILWPLAVDRTLIDCLFLFPAEEAGRVDFDPADVVEFWDLVNRQDWSICESVQRGMQSRVFDRGYYAPMEDLSLDIRRYIDEKMGYRD